jgi:glycerol-3-phosphate dehydrogenase
MFYDGQMDDARLGLTLAKTAVREGATALNYCEVTALHHDQSGQVTGLTFVDRLVPRQEVDGEVDGEGEERLAEIKVDAKVVINATGVFIDKVRSLEDNELAALVRPSQGAHVVLPRRFLPNDRAVVFPETPDGRVLFAVPWYDRVLIGTTDVYRGEVDDEPAPLAEEIDFILDQAREHFSDPPGEDDILSVFAGLRPLVAPPQGQERSTSKISREHNIMIGRGGVFHITGGKWTTYRKMAEDMLEAVIREERLPHTPCTTATLKLVGWSPTEGALDIESVYGAELSEIKALSESAPELTELLDPRLPYRGAHVVFAARAELAMTVEDVLSRRTRALLLDARASIDIAPKVARLLARELDKDEAWERDQVSAFRELAGRYLWPPLQA